MADRGWYTLDLSGVESLVDDIVRRVESEYEEKIRDLEDRIEELVDQVHELEAELNERS